jgi:hypothetical protein
MSEKEYQQTLYDMNKKISAHSIIDLVCIRDVIQKIQILLRKLRKKIFSQIQKRFRINMQKT